MSPYPRWVGVLMAAHSATAARTAAFQRGDTLVTTGTLIRMVDGFVDDPLEPVETPESHQDPERVPEDVIASQRSSATVTAYVGRHIEYWDAGDTVRHRRKEMHGMATLSALGGPARATKRVAGSILAVALGYTIKAYLFAYDVLGGLLARLASKGTWSIDLVTGTTVELPGVFRSIYSAVKGRVVALGWVYARLRARFLIAQLRTSYGFTIRRQLAIKASKVVFLAGILSALVGGFAIVILLGTRGIPLSPGSSPIYIAGLTVSLLALGFYFDTVAERADLHRYDLLVNALPAEANARHREGWGAGNGFWETWTSTDTPLPAPADLRLHERAEAGPLPMYPELETVGAGSPRRRTPQVVEPIYEAGAWF